METEVQRLETQGINLPHLANWWAPEVDLFGFLWDRQVLRFMSWKPQLESVALDAFMQNLKDLRGYAFPHSI